MSHNMIKTIEYQRIIIQQCLYRIGELEQYINAVEPTRKVEPFNYIQEKPIVANLRTTVGKLFTNPPPIMDLSRIEKITDKHFLMVLETKYDNFIEKNEYMLLQYDFIEDLLDIRDAIILRINRIKRHERLNGIL
jgi:hypothetical protein